MMHITTAAAGLQLLSAMIVMAASAEAQKMTLGMTNVPLELVFDEIERQSEVTFVYKPEVLKTVSEVSIKVSNEPLTGVLRSLEQSTPLAFKKVGKMIGVSAKASSPYMLRSAAGGLHPPSGAKAQIRVSGTVTGSSGEPLVGVNIYVKGSSTGVATDEQGRFVLEAVEEDAILVVSYIGYKTMEVSVSGRTEIALTMSEDTETLDEVVAIGYGTQKKSSLTGAIAKVDNELLDQMPASRVESALAGRLAGVSVVTSRSRPGEAPLIRIRGVGSIDAGNNPLVVIDGFPGGSLAQLNMNDVESIEVLKDASAAAIYGSRGAGGVIIVTTKRGTGEPQLNLNAYYGVSVPILHDDWLTGKEWYDYLVKYQNREFAWAGGDVSLPVFGDAKRPVKYQVNPLTYELPQTVWQDEVTQNAPIANYNLSLGGGKNDTRYYISASVKNEEGTVKTSSYKQYGLRVNLDTKVNDRIDIGAELNPYYTQRRIAGSNMVSLVKYPPFVPPVNEEGKYPRTQDYIPTGHSGQASPYVFLYGTHNRVNSFSNLGRAFINIRLAEGLAFKTSAGVNITFNSTDYFRGGAGDDLVPTQGSASDFQAFNLISENTLNYNRIFNSVHEVAGLLGASYQRQNSRGTDLAAVAGSYNNELIHTLNNAIINPAATGSSKSEWGLVSYFGRLNYAYDDRYLLSASLRTDASSRFGNDNKWAIFPAASVAWRMSQEEFLKNSALISELKIRASYGATGNFNIGDFAYLARVGSVSYSPDNSIVNGLATVSFENPVLGWEKTTSNNLGLDLGLFNDRVYLSADLYDKRTTDLLYNVSIPALTGFSSTIANIGEVRNTGIELELTTRNLTGALSWNTSFNISRNKNEVVDLGEVNERVYNHSLGMSWILREGEPMFSYYGYKMTGVYQSREEVESTPHLAGAKPGNPIVQDQNNDGRIDPQDKIILGNFQPKVIMGMTHDLSWKNFDLNITLQATLGSDMYDLENQYYQGNVMGAMRRSLVENQWWSPEEPGDGKTPAAALSQLVQYNANTDYYVEDASYMTVRNLNLGYTFSPGIARKIGMKRLRVYASVNNLIMIRSKENYAYNPEGFTGGEINGINSIPGFNSGSEPVTRVFALGLNVGF